MRISLIGYGKMGKEIEKMAKLKGIEIVSIIDPTDSSAKSKKITKASLNNADVAIDFTTPDAAIGNLKLVSVLGKNMVMGTSAWYDKVEEAKEIVKKNNIGFIYGPNFSIGVNIYMKIVEESAKLFDKAKDYDVFVYEEHHNQKVDSPSGTAKNISDIVLKNVKRKKRAVYDRVNRKILPSELHVASVRAGSIPGTHVLGFDSEADTIEIKHTARNRSGFAMGALLAASWIKNKKGFYTFDDLMKDFFNEPFLSSEERKPSGGKRRK